MMACCICELLDRQNYSLYPLSLLLASGSTRRATIDMRKTYARRPLMRLHKEQVIKPHWNGDMYKRHPSPWQNSGYRASLLPA